MAIDVESTDLFESRKADHIRLALDESMQASGGSGLDRIRLIHEALPEIDFSEVSLATTLFGQTVPVPLFISSMTAGHAGSLDLNRTLATVAGMRGWPMGVGSQRRQLTDPTADQEWVKIREACPNACFFGNIGLAQLIHLNSSGPVRRLVDSLQASAMIVHTNPLQEAMQPEGTPQFAGGLKALERLVRELPVPVILKETGCGFSAATLQRLKGIGLAVVDVSGFGGTHWGRIEGGRSKEGEMLRSASETFRDWGIGTVESLEAALDVKGDFEVWASGGVQSGLDAAKLLAMGASMVGFAKTLMESALLGEERLDKRMELIEFELKTALFCTGTRVVPQLKERRVWQRHP